MLRYTIIDKTSGTDVTTVIDEPVSFDAIELHLGRDKNYHGFFDQVNDTVNGLKYYKAGYAILKAAYQNFGIDADVKLMIEFSCDDTSSFLPLYTGRFNFSKYKETTGVNGCYVEVGLENGNWLMWFKNRMDHEVPLDSRECFDEGYAQLPNYAGLGMSIVLPPKSIKQLDYAVYNYVPQYYAQP